MPDTAAEVLKSPEDAAQLVIQTLDTVPAKIKSRDEYMACMAKLAEAKERKKRVEEFFLKLRQPYIKAQNENRATEKAMLQPLEERYTKLKSLCDAWFMADQAETKRKQDAANAKHQEKVEKAIAAGKDPALVVPPKQIETKAPDKIAVGGGKSISMRMDKHFQFEAHPTITSKHLIENKIELYKNSDPLKGLEIPDHCLLLDRARLLEHLKNGATIKGITLIELPVNTLR